ncbi:hypothetical protein IPM62_01855 [Candidatus Woesebacteria bacterium]|nr:MAG: hypothetical protein IPM62_01855 [Candidatus Woesebacteria bacterium]
MPREIKIGLLKVTTRDGKTHEGVIRVPVPDVNTSTGIPTDFDRAYNDKLNDLCKGDWGNLRETNLTCHTLQNRAEEPLTKKRKSPKTNDDEWIY